MPRLQTEPWGPMREQFLERNFPQYLRQLRQMGKLQQHLQAINQEATILAGKLELDSLEANPPSKTDQNQRWESNAQAMLGAREQVMREVISRPPQQTS